MDAHLFRDRDEVARFSDGAAGTVESASALYAMIRWGWDGSAAVEVEQGDPDVYVVRRASSTSDHDPETDGPLPHEQAAAIISAFARPLP
ncbi:MAG: hypothetical protein AB1941_10045 [Gemmatimonadota bacterium]